MLLATTASPDEAGIKGWQSIQHRLTSLRAAEYLQSSSQGGDVVPDADQGEPALTLACEIVLVSFDADFKCGFQPFDDGFAKDIYGVRMMS